MWRQAQGPAGVLRGSVAGLIALVVVGFTGWTVFGGVPYQGREQQNVDAVVRVLDQFMAAALQRDSAAASRFVQSGSAALTPVALDQLFRERRDVFNGYQSISQENYGIGLKTGWTGTRAVLTGNVSYSDRASTPYQAEFLKRNNQWRLVTIMFGEELGLQPTQ